MSEFTAEQIDLIKRQIAPPGTTDDELRLFLAYCYRTGLDPFARQIYLAERRSFDQETGRWELKRVPETTIDGFRLIAERSGHYAGQQGPFWCGSNAEWTDVWIDLAPPAAAKVGVLRDDFKEPLYSIAVFTEYCQTKKDGKPNQIWSRRPAGQLAKCAEALALRRAFPREMSGLYTREEMGQEQNEGGTALQAQVADDKITEIKSRRAIAAAEEEKAGRIKKGSISFNGLQEIGRLKKTIEEFTRGTDAYYEILRRHGVEHANELDQVKGREVYKDLALLINRLKEETGLRDVLARLRDKLGATRFHSILGQDFGIESIEEVLNMDGERLQSLFIRLQDEVKLAVTTEDLHGAS